MNMATESIVKLLAAFERNFGIDYSTTTNVQYFYKYLLQASDSSQLPGFGDSGGSTGGGIQFGSQIHSQWFVYRTGILFSTNILNHIGRQATVDIWVTSVQGRYCSCFS